MAPRGAWTTSLAGKWEQTTTPLTTVPLPLLFEVQIEYHILLQEIIQLAQAPTFGYRSYVSEYSTVSLARTCKKNSIAIIRILHSFYTHDCASQRIFIPASKTSKTRLTDLDIYISKAQRFHLQEHYGKNLHCNNKDFSLMFPGQFLGYLSPKRKSDWLGYLAQKFH